MKWALNVLLPLAVIAAAFLLGQCHGSRGAAARVAELEARNAAGDSARAAADARAAAAEQRATVAEQRAAADSVAADSAEAHARRLERELAAPSEIKFDPYGSKEIGIDLPVIAPDSAEVIAALSGALTACSKARTSCSAAAQRWKAAHEAEADAHDVTAGELEALREWAADALQPSWWERNDQYVALGVGLAGGFWLGVKIVEAAR